MFSSRRIHVAPAFWILIVVAKNLLLRSAVVEASSQHLSVRVRQTQEESAAYTKCFDVLDSITGDDVTLSQSQYVEFLAQMLEGDDSIAPSVGFEDLDAVYILIFYMTACEDASNCTPSMSPQSIPIGDTTDPSDNLRLLCRAVLREGETKVDANFQYSIQYDTTALDDGKIGECLSTATVNVLLDLFGCDTSIRRQRRREEQLKDRSLSLHGFVELNNEFRRDLQVGSVISSANDDCPYMVSSSVENLVEQETCGEEGADVGIENDAVECGLVSASVSIETNQFLEPFSTILRSRVLDALRMTINDRNFLQFFPLDSGCFTDS